MNEMTMVGAEMAGAILPLQGLHATFVKIENRWVNTTQIAWMRDYGIGAEVMVIGDERATTSYHNIAAIMATRTVDPE